MKSVLTKPDILKLMQHCLTPQELFNCNYLLAAVLKEKHFPFQLNFLTILLFLIAEVPYSTEKHKRAAERFLWQVLFSYKHHTIVWFNILLAFLM